jgi:hypothetical protein
MRESHTERWSAAVVFTVVNLLVLFCVAQARDLASKRKAMMCMLLFATAIVLEAFLEDRLTRL